MTISASAALAVIIFIRLARRTESRSRSDERLTVVLCTVFGVLIAATPWGQAILRLVGVVTRATL
ncbi:hypothetical protein RMN57_00745 [Kitasatospora sp. CM 4170]|uniref:Uncharacterized protein n=1 Tax=Kitasatospora aburaviensis TaxID=67265 RepID=A0ABW1F6A6_9ACTN|nr:hypothetical protein [Kitasatospora sp. CM 4170]WNM43336.1 hypothetical protein RMN57_00745 [Kitasatospora sp. CM 4170]